MLTRKYINGLFRCDYNGHTTIADTRRGARKAMEDKIFGCCKQLVLH